MLHLTCDTHTHTIFSRHAYSTVEENVRAAVEQGFALLGVTDHFSPMIQAESTTGVDLRDYQQFINLEMWPREWHGVHLMRGCEADIVDTQGHLYGWDMPLDWRLSGPVEEPGETLQEAVFGQCDYVIASVHSHRWAAGASPEQLTEMYIHALEHPKVLILGHVGRSGLDFDVEAVATRARELGKLIEINEGSLFGRHACTERCRDVARRCLDAGCMVSTGSDAHISSDVARLDRTADLLESVGYPASLVATCAAETFLEAWANALS